MKKKIHYFIWIFCLLLNACSPEDQSIEQPVSNVDIPVILDSPDEYIPVRIIVTNALNGQILENQYLATPNATTNKYNIKVQTGKLNFYVLANEPVRLTPALNTLTHQVQLESMKLQFSELPFNEETDGNTTATNLPAMEIIHAEVRTAQTINPSSCEISTDNGITWSPSLEVKLKRLASKISFHIRKNTENENDILNVQKIEIINIPLYSHLLKQSYTDPDLLTLTPYNNVPGVALTENADISQTDNYTTIFENLITPEYILAENTIDNAVIIKLQVNYNNEKTVSYQIPIKTGESAANYSLERNKHHIIKATIASEGELIYMPEVRYQIADWNDAGGDISFVEDSLIDYTAGWVENTNIVERNIHVANNEYVEYNFKLSNPSGALWSATITNPIDFIFDNINGAVSSGIGNSEKTYKIRIRPRREVSQNNIKTEFYITINNGFENIELNLSGCGTGNGNRYVINQIPE